MKKQTLSTVLKVLVLLGLFTAILLNYKTLSTLDIRVLIAGASSVFAAACIVLGVYALKSVVFVIPASLIYISVGMAFSTPVALLVNTLGIALEVTISYLFGHFLGGEKVMKMLEGKKGFSILEKLRNKGRFAFIFLLRFSPFPIDFGSLFFGASDFAFPSYFLMSLLGILPRVFVFTILGVGIYELIPMKYILLAVLCALPVAVIAFVILTVRKNKLKSGDCSASSPDKTQLPSEDPCSE